MSPRAHPPTRAGTQEGSVSTMAIQRWRPRYRRIAVPDPAAGVNLLLPNDSGGYWLLMALTLRLVTSAVAGNRTMRIDASSAEDVWFSTIHTTNHAASTTRDYSAWPGAPCDATNSTGRTLGLPNSGLLVPAGHVVRTAVDAIDAGDQISRAVAMVWEYPEVLPSHIIPSPSLYDEDSQE